MANMVTKSYSIDSGLTGQTFTPPAGVDRVQMTVFTGARRQNSHPQNNTRFELADSGAAYAWGNGGSGALGDGTAVDKSSPVAVVGGLRFTQVSSGGQSGIGLDLIGRAWTWGLNSSGQLGDGASVVSTSSPILLVGGLKFKYVSCGPTHMAALTEDGRAYAWGLNTSGGLGDVSVVPKSSPVAVVGGLRFKKIVCGNGWTMGLTEDGRAHTWGSNAAGQLGDVSVVPKSSPVAVVGGLTFSDITAGYGSVSSSTAAAITTAGAAYGWGSNDYGQLGDNSTTDRSSPVAVVGGLTFRELASSESAMCGLTTAGAAYAWGTNNKGQTGMGTRVILQYSSPIAVVGGLTFVSISSTTSSSANARDGAFFGMTAAGALYAWGGNATGQLADGTVVAKSSPIAVIGGLTFRSRGYVNIGTHNVNVVPNTAYSLDFSTFIFSFNSVAFGTLVTKVEFRYFA